MINYILISQFANKTEVRLARYCRKWSVSENVQSTGTLLVNRQCTSSVNVNFSSRKWTIFFSTPGNSASFLIDP